MAEGSFDWAACALVPSKRGLYGVIYNGDVAHGRLLSSCWATAADTLSLRCAGGKCKHVSGWQASEGPEGREAVCSRHQGSRPDMKPLYWQAHRVSRHHLLSALNHTTVSHAECALGALRADLTAQLFAWTTGPVTSLQAFCEDPRTKAYAKQLKYS